MLWRTMHQLFGWNYVHLQGKIHDGVCLVHYTNAGERFVTFRGQTIFIDRQRYYRITELTKLPPTGLAVTA